MNMSRFLHHVFHVEHCVAQSRQASMCEIWQDKGRKQQELLQGNLQPRHRIFGKVVLIIRKIMYAMEILLGICLFFLPTFTIQNKNCLGVTPYHLYLPPQCPGMLATFRSYENKWRSKKQIKETTALADWKLTWQNCYLFFTQCVPSNDTGRNLQPGAMVMGILFISPENELTALEHPYSPIIL